MVSQNGQANSRYHCSVLLLSWFLLPLRPRLLRQTCLRLMYAPAQTKTPSPHLFATSICFAPLCRSFRRRHYRFSHRPCRFRCRRCRCSASLPSWLLRRLWQRPWRIMPASQLPCPAADAAHARFYLVNPRLFVCGLADCCQALYTHTVHSGFGCGSAYQILLPFSQGLDYPLSGLGLSSMVSTKVLCRPRQYLTLQASLSCPWFSWLTSRNLSAHSALGVWTRKQSSNSAPPSSSIGLRYVISAKVACCGYRCSTLGELRIRVWSYYTMVFFCTWCTRGFRRRDTWQLLIGLLCSGRKGLH